MPLVIGILIFSIHSIPMKNGRFWIVSMLAAILGLINTFKSIFIFDNPIFPFANNIFLSRYWDEKATDGMRNLFGLESGSLIEFLKSVLMFLVGHPVSFILLIVAFIWFIKNKEKATIEKPLKDYLKILSFSWIIGLTFWILFFSPKIYPRFIIGFVFLTTLLPTTFAINNLCNMFHPKYQKWQNLVGGIALLLTISVSHIDIDFKQARHWISSQSFHNHWLESSNLAEVQNYLNNKVSPKTRVLFHYTTQRFHANFIVYGARNFSPRTRFVFSKDKTEIIEGLKKIKPKYYVIRKDKIGISGGLLENKSFLDEKFTLEKKFKEYLLYKVTKNIEMS